MGICGDVNGDGKVNTGDVTLLLNHISDPEKYPLDEWAGDVNGDGVIDIGDVTLLLNHISDPEMFPLHCRAEKKRHTNGNYRRCRSSNLRRHYLLGEI